jgi:hypothetical protein
MTLSVALKNGSRRFIHLKRRGSRSGTESKIAASILRGGAFWRLPVTNFVTLPNNSAKNLINRIGMNFESGPAAAV